MSVSYEHSYPLIIQTVVFVLWSFKQLYLSPDHSNSCIYPLCCSKEEEVPLKRGDILLVTSEGLFCCLSFFFFFFFFVLRLQICTGISFNIHGNACRRGWLVEWCQYQQRHHWPLSQSHGVSLQPFLSLLCTFSVFSCVSLIFFIRARL